MGRLVFLSALALVIVLLCQKLDVDWRIIACVLVALLGIFLPAPVAAGTHATRQRKGNLVRIAVLLLATLLIISCVISAVLIYR